MNDSFMQQTFYNVTGATARMQIAAADESATVTDIGVTELFQLMRQEVMTAGEFGSDVGEALYDRIDQMQDAIGTPSFPRKYASFLLLAADHIEMFRPFLPALSQLLL